MVHSKQRYLFIDLLRFIAVFFMIQGHVFDALLDHTVRVHSLYYIHDFFHGFIAPIFLFASGTAFGVSTFKKWEEHIVAGKRFWKRIGKFVGLLMIGYALHLPYFSLHKIIVDGTPQEINSWLQVDALHCIAVSLLFLQMVVILVKNEKRVVQITAALTVFIILLSPVMWSTRLTGILPVWAASYLNADNSSWFPLFPWSAYIFAGVVFGWVFINAKEHHHAVALMQKNISISLAVIAAALFILFIPVNLYPPHDFWKTNPAMISIRLSVVCIVTSGIFFAEHSVKIPSRIPLIMGRESLFIYIVHLIIVYGSVLNIGLNTLIGPHLSVMNALFVFGGLFIVMIGVTYVWYELKLKHGTAAFWIRAGISVVLLSEFIFRPW
ncbi:MAG: heparan-alpha-glucosaminide N-acetyltransferase domain-containing protein [Bacteroidota bacterium]